MNLHLDQPALTSGAPLAGCRAAAILVHGRGRTPGEMIALAEQFDVPGVAYVAPAAAGQSWYPQSFLAPPEQNEPFLSDALAVYAEHVAALQGAGVPLWRIVLLGFSQGACLTAEYAARHSGRYGGIVAFTGGLIGPQGTEWERHGDFAGTPVLIGGAERDGWVPAWRMRESAEHFRRLGAEVTTLFYNGDSHIVSEGEIAAAREILRAATEAA